MFARLLGVVLVLGSLTSVGGCASKGKYVPVNLSKDELEQVSSGKLVKLQQVLPEKVEDKLVLNASVYPNGVIVCAIENLSKPCLPKLSKLVAGKLAQKGVVVTDDKEKADAVVYFETQFDSYATGSSMVKAIMANPAVASVDFAAKMEQSLVSGNDPDVHKHFRFVLDPFQMMSINANDEQKFVYVALSAVPVKDAVPYPGKGNEAKSENSNLWVKEGGKPATRTLVGNFDGKMETSKSVSPMFNDALEILAERVVHEPVVVSDVK